MQQQLRLQHQRVPTTVNRSSGHLRVVAMAAEGAGGPEDLPSEGPLPPGPAPQESPGKAEAEAVATARPLRQKAAAAAARERREQRRAAREQPAAEEVPASAELTSPELWRREEAEALAAEEAAAAFVSVAPEPAPEPSLEPEAEPEPELGAELDLEAGPGPEQEPQPEPEPALSVECPEGCGAGDLLNVEVEGGVVQVEVPEGVAAGDVFEVHLAHGADGEAAAEGVGAEHEQDEPGTESDDSGSDVDVDAAAAAALELELAADSPPSVPAGRRRAPAVPARGGHTTAAAANEVGDARKARLDKIAAERKAAAVPRRGDRLRVQRNSRKAPPAPAIDAPLEEMQGAVAADSVSCEDDELRTLEVRLLGLSLERLRDRAEAVGVDQDALEDIDVETDRDSAKLEIVALILTLAKHAQDLGKTSPSASLLSSATLLSELHQQETAAAVRLQSNVRGTLVRREYQARLAKRVEPTSVTSVEDSPAAQAAAARQQKGIELLHWLSALRCQEYLTKLVEFGVESVADMAEVTEQDLVEQGMKPLHRRRVLRAAAALAIEEDTGADASEEEEFTEVEEVESDDDGGADEDFDTMKKAIETSSALTPRRGRPDYVSPYSQRKLRLSPANSSGSAEGRKSSSPPQTSITPRSETEAKLLVSNDVTVAKRKLRAMSYGTTGQDPRNLFNNYDRDNSGELDWSEFKSAVRKGGKVSTATLSDGVLRKLFDAVDGDGSGDVSIEELTAFVWGNQNRLGAEDGSSAADRAAPPADEIEMAIDGALSLPSKAERDQAFDRMDENGNGALSFAEIDKAIVEIWPEYHHKKSIMRAYKAADVDGSGYIGRKEFGLLLKYLVYFNQMWDKFAELDRDGDGRLDVNEFHDGAQMLGLDVTWAATVEEFGAMDEDGGGTVMFDEFCAWCARRGVPKGGTGSTKKRTSVSQKESASRLSSSAYAGRLARSSPASTPQGKSPPSGQQDKMKTPMSGAELPVAVAAMLDQAGLSSAGKQKCRRHASDLARGDLLLLNDSHAVRHFVRQRLGFDRVRDAEDTAKLCDWIRLEKEVEAAGLESTGPDDSRFRRTRFEFVKGLHDVVLIDPGHYQGGGVVSYIATDRGHCGASSDPVWVNPHTAARMVVSWSSARNGQEAMLVRAALRPHQKDKALLSTDDRRGSWMQLDLASRRSSKNSAQLIAASSTDPTGRAPMRDRMMRRMKVDRYVLQNAGLGRALGRWQLQGANEDEVGDPEEPVQWTVLHDGSGMPRENHAIADFAVSPPHSFVEEDDDNDSRNYFRFFRIVQFGRNVGCDGSDAVRRYLSDLGHERQVSQEGAANIRVYATHTAEVVFVLSAPRFGYDQSDYVCVLREMQRSKTLNSFLAACLKAHAVDRASQFLPHVVGGTSAADVEAKVMRRAAWDSTPTALPRSPISGSDSSRGRPGRSSGSSRSSRGGKRLEVPDDQPLPSGTEVFVKPGYATRYVPTDTGRAPGVIVEYLLPENRYAVELDTGDRLWPVHPELIEERASIDGDYRLSLGGIELYGVLREQRQTS